MSKTIKIILSLLIGLPLLLVAIVVGVFMINDANDFKPTIEEQAKNQIGLNLKIEDQLSWSLIPIGLEIGKLRILDQSEAPFASAEQIIASIDFWSLFSGSPKVKTILVDGLKLDLIQKSETENNWSNILPPKENNLTAPEQTPPEENTSQAQAPLNFLVESLEIINTNITYDSVPQALKLSLNPLDLKLNNITLGDAFPISLSYTLKEAQNNIELRSSLNANLFASKDLKQFKLSQLQNSYQLKAPDIISQTINLDVQTDIAIDTETEVIDIASLMLKLNEVVLNGKANIKQYSQNPAFQADITLKEFSLKELLNKFDIPLPEMQNNAALEKVGMSTTFKLENNLVQLDDFKLLVDDTTWTSTINHNLDTAASKIRIKGNALKLDGYLPPEKDAPTDTEEEIEPEANNTAAQEDNDLLPIDTLKSLNIDFELQQESISLKDVESKDILVAFTAKNGIITQNLKGGLFDGSYASDLRIDASQAEPKWATEQTLKDIKLKPIFETLNIEALKEYGTISGLINLTATTSMSGNKISKLKPSADSVVDFHIAEGAFEGLSVNALTCQGFALINKEVVDTSSWPKATPFNTLKGKAILKKEALNTEFDLITSGVHADSQGTIDIANSSVNILASLKVIGGLGDEACRVNEKVTKIGIPVKCEGAMDTPPAELCKLDTSRLGEMAKELAIEEGKRKANKEIDRALDKHLGDKKEQVKSLLKKLF